MSFIHHSEGNYFPGYLLLLEIEDFYISYGSWRTEYPENFHCFSLLKKVTEVSMKKGHFLTEKEERELLGSLSDVRERLYGGSLKHSQVPFSISQMVLNLIIKNPKAKLIAHAIELEYFLQGKKQFDALRMIEKMIGTVDSQLSELSAQAAAKELAALLTKLAKDPKIEIFPILESTFKHLEKKEP